jgi:hypothetical protein
MVYYFSNRGHSRILKVPLAAGAGAFPMGIIHRYRLTTAEAEAFMVRLWCGLEEHGIPSPRLRVHKAGESLVLHTEFLSEEDAVLISGVMPPLVIEPEPPLMPMQARIIRLRLRAEELRTIAEQFSNPVARQSLLSAAANYEKLAEVAERSLTAQPFVLDDRTG